MQREKLNSKAAETQTLEHKPGVPCRAPTMAVFGAASSEGHVKIWCNSARHVEMHAFEPARCCKTDYSKPGFHALRAPLGISHPCKS